ncbi:MAG: ABC transporter transmembrane domain-containing protein [Bacteroidia bacterium]|nr:ABC transporter transmembrane domain-containing protein [Bacteroidia bacterium]
MGKRRVQNNEEEKVKVTRESFGEALKIFSFVRPYRWYFIIGLVFLALSTGTNFLFIDYIRELLATVTDKVPEWQDKLRSVTIQIVVVLILQAAFSFLRIILFAQVTQRTLADIRNAIYHSLLSIGIPFFEERRVGELTSRLTADVSQLESTIQVSIAEFLRQILTLVGGIIILFYVSVKLSLIMLSTFPVAIIIAMGVGRYIRKVSKKAQDELAESNVIVEETLHSIRNVKSFVNEKFEFQKFGEKMREVIKNGLNAAYARGGFVVVLILAVFGGMALVMVFGAGMIGNEELPVDQFIYFLMITAFIGGSIAGLGSLYAEIQRAIGASERIRGILKEEGEYDFMNAADTGERFAGEIVFSNVEFAYPTRLDVPVLKGISLKIPQGNKIALAGQSGAGKSTIAQLLLRFYQIQGGEILIDGKSIFDYDLHHLRSNIGIVPQEVILFGGTIKENIAYGRPGATEEEIIDAARKANALEFIQNFPEGLETKVGDRGIKLSGGQRQRIAIARAILKDPVILILDEATSSLDAESEHLVQEALNKLMHGRTTLIIAHRLSTIRHVDQINVMEAGKIVESGTHNELADQNGGAYFNLLRLQEA